MGSLSYRVLFIKIGLLARSYRTASGVLFGCLVLRRDLITPWIDSIVYCLFAARCDRLARKRLRIFRISITPDRGGEALELASCKPRQEKKLLADYPPWNQTKMKIIIPFPLPPGNDYLYVAVALLQTKQHPSSSEEALGHKDWKSAMEAEYDALMKNKTWHCSSERYECHRM